MVDASRMAHSARFRVGRADGGPLTGLEFDSVENRELSWRLLDHIDGMILVVSRVPIDGKNHSRIQAVRNNSGFRETCAYTATALVEQGVMPFVFFRQKKKQVFDAIH